MIQYPQPLERVTTIEELITWCGYEEVPSQWKRWGKVGWNLPPLHEVIDTEVWMALLFANLKIIHSKRASEARKRLSAALGAIIAKSPTPSSLVLGAEGTSTLTVTPAPKGTPASAAHTTTGSVAPVDSDVVYIPSFVILGEAPKPEENTEEDLSPVGTPPPTPAPDSCPIPLPATPAPKEEASFVPPPNPLPVTAEHAIPLVEESDEVLSAEEVTAEWPIMTGKIMGEGIEARQPVQVGPWALTRVGNDVRILDIELAQHLGYEEPRMIRKLVKRMIEDKRLPGRIVCRDTVERLSLSGGAFHRQTTQAYDLTYEQALTVVTQSKAKRAIQMTNLIIRVFMMATQGVLSVNQPSPAAMPAYTNLIPVEQVTTIVAATVQGLAPLFIQSQQAMLKEILPVLAQANQAAMREMLDRLVPLLATPVSTAQKTEQALTATSTPTPTPVAPSVVAPVAPVTAIASPVPSTRPRPRQPSLIKPAALAPTVASPIPPVTQAQVVTLYNMPEVLGLMKLPFAIVRNLAYELKMFVKDPIHPLMVKRGKGWLFTKKAVRQIYDLALQRGYYQETSDDANGTPTPTPTTKPN